MERLVQRIRQNVGKKQPKDLQGLWKGKFPEDFDIDGALFEIRNAWKKDFPEFNE